MQLLIQEQDLNSFDVLMLKSKYVLKVKLSGEFNGKTSLKQ